jgi:hypothetical protein
MQLIIDKESLLQKPLNVIPAKAGIQTVRAFLGPRFREGDGILEFCKSLRRYPISGDNLISRVLWMGNLKPVERKGDQR